MFKSALQKGSDQLLTYRLCFEVNWPRRLYKFIKIPLMRCIVLHRPMFKEEALTEVPGKRGGFFFAPPHEYFTGMVRIFSSS